MHVVVNKCDLKGWERDLNAWHLLSAFAFECLLLWLVSKETNKCVIRNLVKMVKNEKRPGCWHLLGACVFGLCCMCCVQFA